MGYLVHHTFKQNKTYTGGNLNHLPFDEKYVSSGFRCRVITGSLMRLY